MTSTSVLSVPHNYIVTREEGSLEIREADREAGFVEGGF